MANAQARALRKSLTDAERKLWRVLRALPADGSHFRRQSPIGPYIADFVHHRAKLVIEVDGGQHADNGRDRTRDAWFEAQGYRVIRFWNNEVLGNTEAVVTTIIAESERRMAHMG
jgi:2-isopropylmalate synthase